MKACAYTVSDETELDHHLKGLWQSACSGDIAAFESLYSATVRLLLPVVRRICGEAHAEDALADAYLQAWKNLNSFEADRGSVLSWLRTIARSRALDCRRRERVRHAGAHGAIEWNPDEHPCTLPGPQDLVQQAQQDRSLQSAVRTVPARHQLVVDLAYYRDCSHSEISSLTGLPLGTVKTLIRQSQRRLHGMMSAPLLNASPT